MATKGDDIQIRLRCCRAGRCYEQRKVIFLGVELEVCRDEVVRGRRGDNAAQ